MGMKFLLLVKERANRPHEADPAGFNRVIRDHITRLFENGTLERAYYMLPRGGACIINASSHEALLGELRSWPGAYQHDFELYPLCDLLTAIDENYARNKPADEPVR
jgi:hypothetical protein